jgi:iron complex outermembrane receptor protein/vitamin B12 transporter
MAQWMNARSARGVVSVMGMLVALLVPALGSAQQSATVSGSVLDPLGARVGGATVALVGGAAVETMSNADGTYAFTSVAPGRYQVVARAQGFEASSSDTIYVAPGAAVSLDLTLQLGPLQQAVVVTANASEVQQAQTGAPVTVIDAATLTSLNKPDLHEALRLVPGSQVQQTGARGGTASMFVRGGSSNFTKVLMDGIAANDIGGGFDFSQIQTTGVERVEILRQSNSVIYGSDALTGVINIETRRGRTRVPELSYTIDGGNLGTFRNSLAGGGAVKRVDYFSQYSYFTTDNEVPNNRYRNGTYAGRFGVTLGGGTDLSGTVRHIVGKYGSPNGILHYGIADDSSSEADLTYAGVTARSQWSDRWQSTVRFGSTGQTTHYLNPAPTGEAFDPFGFGANYIGNQVTIHGANGYSVTGRAILDYSGSYPSRFDSRTTRRALFGQTTVRVASDLHISGGARYEREQGYSDPDGEPDTTRNNSGAFVEGRGSLGGRTYLSAGLGYEHNDVFKSAVTPRVSVAVYVRNPARGRVGDTKVVFNAGKGIKAPAIYQEQSSLFALLQTVPPASRPSVEPIGPERSRSIDAGIEQGFADGSARIRVSYFMNRFEDLIEYVSKNVLPQVGVPPAAAAATQFGAYVNSSSYDAQGLELSGEAVVARSLRLMASYTYLDAEVTESFAGSALAPATNPSIPGVPIGAFSPLVGARPFRRPSNSGSLMASYTRGPVDVTLSAFFSGKRDGSTFLSDQFFGNSLLLPNRDLEEAYQKVDLAAAYRVHPRLKAFMSIENLLDKEYAAAAGFPALPLTGRIGVTVDFGGVRNEPRLRRESGR